MVLQAFVREAGIGQRVVEHHEGGLPLHRLRVAPVLPHIGEDTLVAVIAVDEQAPDRVAVEGA
ncbi:MAG: hypothetical protein R2712_21200 [Vicinamibacterales bacterium]